MAEIHRNNTTAKIRKNMYILFFLYTIKIVNELNHHTKHVSDDMLCNFYEHLFMVIREIAVSLQTCKQNLHIIKL